MDSIVHLKLFMYGILNNSVCLFGLSGNFLLLYIFFLYKDMRKQSINIYLTVLALYDNGVLIFSILMLNLPAITDYQQMSTLMGNSNSSSVQFTLTTPINSFPPGSVSTYYSSTSSIFYPQQHFAITSTRIPPDTGQGNKRADKITRSSTSQRESIMNMTTITARTTTKRATSYEWSTESPSILTVTPSTVLTSIPFHIQPASFSSSTDDSPSSFATSTSFTHPIRHQSSSTSAAPNGVNHRSKRTKRRSEASDYNYAPITASGDLFTFQITSILENCFNLTSDDLHKLRQSMILLNASSSSLSPQPVDQSVTPRDLVERLFFEALFRQLIIWVRMSLHAKLSNHSPLTSQVSIEAPTSTETTSMKYSAVADLRECRRSLLKYYRPEQSNNDSSLGLAERSNDLHHRESMPSVEAATRSPAKDRSQPEELDVDEVTSVSLLLLNTLEEIYQAHIPTSLGSTAFPGADHFYADSLTGEDYLSVDVNESISSSRNDKGDEGAFDEEARGPEGEGEQYPPQPAPGSLYPLLYYVKAVYPLALISQTGSIWTTCLITIERYLAVCHPLMSLTLSTRSRAIWALCILSLAAFLFNLPRFAEVDTTGGSIRPSELRRNKIYYHVYYICLNLSLNYVLPLSLLFALNIKIYASVRHANAHRNELTRARQSELHLASMLVFIVAIFIACNAPAFLVNCMEPYFDVGTPLLEAITIFSNVLVCFNSAINFVIYCIFGKKFRSKLKQLCLFKRNRSARNSHGRNRNYFSQRFSTASRNSSFKLTLATQLQGHVNGPTNGSNHLHHQQKLTGAVSPGRQFSYPHTALLADTTTLPNHGHDSAGEEKCEKTVRSASIPLTSLQANGDTGRHEYHHQGQFSDEEEAVVALNTFV